MDVMSKLTDRAYDLVVLRHDPEDLASADHAHRNNDPYRRRPVIDSVSFGDGKVPQIPLNEIHGSLPCARQARLSVPRLALG